jgi:HAD superfamily hydrolase (TIGR01509 family)
LGPVTGTPLGLVIFDCDGVLVDSEPLAMRALLETLAEAGIELSAQEAVENFLGKSLASTVAELRRTHGVDIGGAALARMRERLYTAFRQELRPIAGVAEMLEGLDRPCCVASSSQPERIRLSLEVAGLSRFFGERLFSATMVAHGKPAPDLFLHAARAMAVGPADCLVVEDSPAGISAALAAGMRAFGFAGGSHARSDAHREKLVSLGPMLVFDDMRALPGLVRQLETSSKTS